FPTDPNVSAAIRPLLTSRRVPAFTVMLPASPVPGRTVVAVMTGARNDEVPSIDSVPVTVTMTLPPLPAAAVLAAIWPLALMVNVSALPVTLPPLPAAEVWADILPLVLMVNVSALTVTLPPLLDPWVSPEILEGILLADAIVKVLALTATSPPVPVA